MPSSYLTMALFLEADAKATEFINRLVSMKAERKLFWRPFRSLTSLWHQFCLRHPASRSLLNMPFDNPRLNVEKARDLPAISPRNPLQNVSPARSVYPFA